MTYQEYVDQAKRLIKQIESHQARVAEMALAICQIRHGGKSDEFYTVTDFAEAIGMNRKTLSEWVATYRDVIVKLDIVNPSQKDWTNATKTHNLLKTQRQVDNENNGTPGGKKSFKQDIPKEKVKKLFDGLDNDDGDLVKIERIFSSTRYNNSLIMSVDLDNVDEDKLLRIMEWLDESSEVINLFLTKNKKKRTA